jgi:GT2 family glycosyltransferase
MNGRVPAPVYERLREAAAPSPAVSADGPARITAVILSRSRPELVAAAVRSVTAATVPVAVLVIDNNSDSATRRVLAALAAEDPRIELRLADRNLGCAGGRRLGIELVETELVLFLDDDAELIPGALEHLLADLDAHPTAAAATGLVVAADGRVHHYGGWIAISEELASFTLDGGGLSFDDPSLAPTGPSGWVPGTATLLRTEALREFPIDAEMAAYYEDNDWCYRVEQARPGSFRRCREALVLHHLDGYGAAGSGFTGCSEKVEKLSAQARFLDVHGRLLDVDLLWHVPELRLPDGSIDAHVARLLLGLIAARGTDWATMAWLNGELEPLLGRAALAQKLGHAHAEARERETALEQAQGEARERETALEQAHGEARERETALEQAQATTLSTLAAVAMLEQRHETLLRIEAGGWWRLRSRLLPLIRVASAVRGITSSRT